MRIILVEDETLVRLGLCEWLKLDARIDAVASEITDPELRRAAFLVGAGLAWLDRGIGEKEGLALQAISRKFDIPMNAMHTVAATITA